MFESKLLTHAFEYLPFKVKQTMQRMQNELEDSLVSSKSVKAAKYLEGLSLNQPTGSSLSDFT